MNQITIDLPQKITGLKAKLKDTGWEHILYPYLDSESFYNTLTKLVTMVQNGTRFTPKMKNWFRSFCHQGLMGLPSLPLT